MWEEHRAWGGVKDLVPRAAERPTTTGRSSAASSATSTACASLDEVGVDNVTFETDYPHTDSTWPRTKKVAMELTSGLAPDVARKLMRGNAIRMLGLDLGAGTVLARVVAEAATRFGDRPPWSPASRAQLRPAPTPPATAVAASLAGHGHRRGLGRSPSCTDRTSTGCWPPWPCRSWVPLVSGSAPG